MKADVLGLFNTESNLVVLWGKFRTLSVRMLGSVWDLKLYRESSSGVMRWFLSKASILSRNSSVILENLCTIFSFVGHLMENQRKIN
jgi:hypothetical protein